MINRNVRVSCGWSAVVLMLLGFAGAANGADAVPVVLNVTVVSGRLFVGQLDPRTDEQKLWLRFERGRASIQRPIDWTEVLEIRLGDEQLTRDRVRQLTGSAEAERAVAAPSKAERPPAQEVIPPADSALKTAEPKELHPAQIRALSLQATPVNWDADVELDGLAVVIFPLDTNGDPAPVTGSLEVWLIGEMPPGYRGALNPQLGRWMVQVRPADFSSRGGVFTLPYQAAHPEFNSELGPFGAVHARLTVPGQGTFETTVTTRIRPSSGFRDRLQQSAGTRFLPGELHGRVN